MWVVLNDAKQPCMNTLKYYRRDSIKSFNNTWVRQFSYWRKSRGFRCVKVEVTIKEVKK